MQFKNQNKIFLKRSYIFILEREEVQARGGREGERKF